MAKQEPIKNYKLKVGSPIESAEFMIAPTDAKNVSSVSDAYDPQSSITLTIFSQGDFISNTLLSREVSSKEPPVPNRFRKQYRAFPYLWKDKLYFFTNDNAPNNKIMVADAKNPHYSQWKTLIPEGKTVIEEYECTSDYILVKDKKDIMSRIMVYRYDGTFVKELNLPELANGWLHAISP